MHRRSRWIEKVQLTIQKRSRCIHSCSFWMQKERFAILREQLTMENVSLTVLRERLSIHGCSFTIPEVRRRILHRSLSIEICSLTIQNRSLTIHFCFFTTSGEQPAFFRRRFTGLFEQDPIHDERSGLPIFRPSCRFLSVPRERARLR